MSLLSWVVTPWLGHRLGSRDPFIDALLVGCNVGLLWMAPLAEELVFRGLLLPRIRAAFGRGDVLASGVLFTTYRLHQPWSMPATSIDGILNRAYPTRRFRSTWMGLISHPAPSFLIVGALIFLVI